MIYHVWTFPSTEYGWIGSSYILLTASSPVDPGVRISNPLPPVFGNVFKINQIDVLHLSELTVVSVTIYIELSNGYQAPRRKR